MANDIVTRLRDPEMCMCDGENPCVVCVALTEIERLRAAGDALAQGVLDTHQPFPTDHHINLWWLVANWQEARRA